MKLTEVLEKKKDKIISLWTEMAHGTYPFGTIGFLRTKNNPFVNPVGHRTKECISGMFAALITPEPNQEELYALLEEFMRVRSVQQFSPEEAIGVISGLKNVIRKELNDEIEKNSLHKELLEVESRIDAIEIMCFGIYTRCREKIYSMQRDEYKRKQSQIIRRAERIIAREEASGIKDDFIDTENS